MTELRTRYPEDEYLGSTTNSSQSLLQQLKEALKQQDRFSSVQESAANLFYTFVKDRSLGDHAGRLAATLLGVVLDKNGVDLDHALPPTSLAALTLLVATSDPDHREPTVAFIQRALTAHPRPAKPALRPSDALRRHVTAITEYGAELGITQIRVFGSVARGDDHVQSDIDLIVTVDAGNSYFDIGALAALTEELTGFSVDIVIDGDRPGLGAIRAEAIPLDQLMTSRPDTTRAKSTQSIGARPEPA